MGNPFSKTKIIKNERWIILKMNGKKGELNLIK